MNLNMNDVIDKYKGCVYKTAYTYVKNKSDAEDVFQEVFLKFWDLKPEFKDEQHEKAWVIRCTINRCKNLLKSAWWVKTEPLNLEYANEERHPVDLYEKLMKLPKKYRIVIYLYYYEEYSIKEMSEILKVKISTLQTWLQRGRERLKIIVKEENL